MTTIDGVGHGGRIVGQLADAARDQDADVRLAVRAVAEPGRAHRLAEARVDLGVGQRHRAARACRAELRSRRMWRSNRNGWPL